MTEITTEEVLKVEALAINGAEIAGNSPREIYAALNALDRTALCLSGGGIRSAAFGLGILQALATHPRVAGGAAIGSAAQSTLAQIHYLSTVSGGGYIGSWLSAWIMRSGYPRVWQGLVGRPDGPDSEPLPLSWLRANSNYLTPRLGMLSADTWADIAVFLRNLLLNWFVILPVPALILLGLKIFAVDATALWRLPAEYWPLFVAIAFTGAGLLAVSLRYRTRHRPTRGTANADQMDFLKGDLIWTALSGAALALCLVSTAAEEWLSGTPQILLKPLIWLDLPTGWLEAVPYVGTIGLTGLAGGGIYAAGWLSAWPARRELPDFLLWVASGVIYGGLIGIGVHLFLDVADASTEWMGPQAQSERVLVILIFGAPWSLLAQLLAEMIFVGLTSYESGSDADREWFGRAAGWMLVTALAWVVVMYLAFIGSEIAPMLLEWVRGKMALFGGISGVLTLLIGKSRLTASEQGRKSTLGISFNLVLSIAAPFFMAALVVLLSALLDRMLLGQSMLTGPLMSYERDRYFDVRLHDLLWLLGGWVGIFLIGCIAWKYININRFSLHSLYRNRLIHAFLAATNSARNPDRFTGFDIGDNPRMRELWPQPETRTTISENPAEPAVTESRWPDVTGEAWRPFHVVNMALNIVSSRRLAWQQRKAEPFVATPLHAGSGCKAYRESDTYGDKLGITLGTAMAISGAAASPNMGYHSSPAITFLLALFNVRLGWWLGNPGREGDKTFRHDAPAIAIFPMIEETFGLTTDSRSYVYLTDGGHFENLGLYEMVRRRCRNIILSDAGCDPNYAFEDLGNAVRKVALDLGITIRFRGLDQLKPRPLDGSDLGPHHPYHAIGEIDYPAADGSGEPGIILFVKAGYHGTESAGVRSYAVAQPEFPHESTADQWFSESQFESYRALGFETMDMILTEARGRMGAARRSPTLAALVRSLARQTAHAVPASSPESIPAATAPARLERIFRRIARR